MGYLNTTISDGDLFNLISERIKNKEPLSMSRLGDGELYFLKRNVPKSLKLRFCEEWGYTMGNYNEGEDLLFKILLDTLNNTEYIGLMNLNNDISKRIKANGEIWGIEDKLIDDLNIVNRFGVCDHQATRGKLFGDINNFKNLLNGENLHIISSRTTELKNNKLDLKLDTKVSYTQVDYNAKLTDRAEIFERILDIKEDVVILSLGVLGKDMPYKIAKNNKVCLDFGATIDAWSGIVSRPWFNSGGLQNHCLIEK